MQSPFTADFPPPIEAPEGVDPEMVGTWTSIAERYEPDDAAHDRAFASMLARADQDALPKQLRKALVEHAQIALDTHRPNNNRVCLACTERYDGNPIPYPCWGVKLAQRVIPSPDADQPVPATDATAGGA